VLILADRELGNSFIDIEKVTFRLYRLVRSTDGIPGRPAYYFDLTETRAAKAKYCDVDEALQKELGV
jgi:hypothetical protein